MVTMMTNNVELKVGRYVIGIMPVLFFLITAFACYNIQAVIDNGQKTIAQMQKENSNLSKRLAASDLKRRDAEQELASQQSKSGQSPGVVIISPEGSKVHTFDAPRAYPSVQKDLIF